MKTLQETIDSHFEKTSNNLLYEYARTTDDLLTLYITDSAMEYAESHEDVIYYNRAHKLIANCDNNELQEAEEEAEELACNEFKSYDELATLIAFSVIRQRAYNQLNSEVVDLIESLEFYEEKLSDCIDELEQELDEPDEQDEESLELMTNELDEVQDLISHLNDL